MMNVDRELKNFSEFLKKKFQNEIFNRIQDEIEKYKIRKVDRYLIKFII